MANQGIKFADLNDERKFLEDLLQQRFNFFVVVFSLIVADGTAAASVRELYLVLFVGLILCTLLGLTVYTARISHFG